MLENEAAENVEQASAESAPSAPLEAEVLEDNPTKETTSKPEVTDDTADTAKEQTKAVTKPKKPRKIIEELTPARPKDECITAYRKHATDVGSTDIQIALLTDRILHLTEHLKIHPKDKHTNYGLRKMVSKRKRLLNYLERTDAVGFTKLKASLNLR